MTVFDEATEARLKVYEENRAREIKKILSLWTELRKRQNLPATRQELNEKLNEWFQIKDGLDALGGPSIEKVQRDLQKAIVKFKR
jgi:nitric oxide reductase activation protein